MAKAVIYKKQLKKEFQFFRDGIMIGTSRYTYGFLMDEIIIYQDNVPKYKFKETDRVVWFLRNCLFLISFIIALFINGRYTIYKGEAEIGYTLEKWAKPIENFVIHDDRYRLFVHKGNRFSLTKNGRQVALYKKRPEKVLETSLDTRDTYDIDYDINEPSEIIELFCLFIDVFFFTPYDGTSHIKVIIPHDRYPEQTLWQPKE